MVAEEIRPPKPRPAPLRREQWVARALALSLLIHLLFFGLWRLGLEQHWWQGGWRPSWLRALAQKMVMPVKVKIPARPAPQAEPTPLLFVDTDPALAVPEPPKNAKFYSANNVLAANKEIKKESDIPNITGSQTKELKATASGKPKAQALQPTPKPQESQEEKAASQPKSRQSITPGDLVMAKPRELMDTNQGKAEVGTGAGQEAQPEHHRPRTIQEALAERGMLGQRTRQSGGVHNLQADPSFTAIGTSYGDYDAEFINAVKTRWYQLLETHGETPPGQVVVEFTLLPTGRVTDFKVVSNSVDDLSGVICRSAILDNAPYRPWPKQMQIDLGADHRDVRFTFYYENE
jgi:outer membrane biosynthesis protein TonB